MIDDVKDSGIEGLEPHLTDRAKETIDAVSYVTDNNLINMIMGFVDQNGYVGILKSEIQKVQWGVDDILKGKQNAAVILSLNYEDKLIGTIEISMLRDEGRWKIDSIEFPKFTEVNW